MKIAQGLQYQVYDEGKRVRKIPNSHLQIVKKLVQMRPINILSFWKLNQKARAVVHERDSGNQFIQQKRGVDALLANPHFNNEIITQDKVIPFGIALNQCEAPKELIQGLVDCMYTCWSHGFSETTFNFTINYGVDANARVVLLDFGELTFDKKPVHKHILEKAWLQSWSFKKDMSADTQEALRVALDPALEIDSLHHHWNSYIP